MKSKLNLDLVILCGGKGSRLGVLTRKIPKPMIKILKQPFLQHLINFYKKNNFQNIYLLAGYKGYQIKKKFHNSKQNLTPIKCIIEKKPLGTGGALSLLKNKIKNDFVLVNGDSFFNTNINRLINFKFPDKCNIKMILLENKNYKTNKTLKGLSIRNKIICFSRKSNLMNSGIYFVRKEILKKIKNNEQTSFENDILENQIKKGFVSGYKDDNFFIDIGIKKQLNYAKKNLGKIIRKPAVFLDRDGVINKDNGYVYRYNKFFWLDGTFDALRHLQKNFYLFIVTNQSGIGRGYYSINDFIKLHAQINHKLQKEQIFINDIEFCPHHPDNGRGKYKINCKCRKPKVGMIKNLIKKFNIDLKRSFFIGDKSSDMLASKRLNIKFFYRENNLYRQVLKIERDLN